MSDDAPSDPGFPGAPGAAVPGGRRVSRKRRAARWSLWILGGTGLLVAALPFVLSTGWMNDVVRAWLRENVERDVDFASLDVSWTEGIRLTGLVVHDEAAGQPPLVEAPLVVLRAPVLPLLVRRLAVSEFVVQDAVVRIAERGDSVSTKGVVKLRRPKRKRAPGESAPEGADEPLVLPEVDIPVQVRNLTLVLADEEGHEARRPGIAFRGRIRTREGPATFDLDIPTAGGGSVRVKGSAALFDPDGVLLAKDRVRVEADVAVRGVDAKANADLLALFLPERPAEGVVDATMKGSWDGGAARGSVDLHVRGVAFDRAVGTRSAMAGDDLTVSAQWAFGGGRVDLRDLKVRAEGLAVDGDLSGDLASLDGTIRLDADLGRMTAALRAFGFPVKATLAGTAKGDVVFTPSPSRGTGGIVLTGFRAEGLAEGRPPVAVDSASVTFVAVPSPEVLTLESFDVKLADVSVRGSGTRTRDGTIDARADAKGDLGGLLERVRDLGWLPRGFAVAGTLDASVTARGRPGATGADALVVNVDRLLLTEDDVRIEAKGTVSGDGAMDLTASGAGDLGKLLGRAQEAGVQGPGLGAVRGRFRFDASAKGPAGAVVVRVPAFHLDGDLAVDASGERAADGALSAEIRAAGAVADALRLASKLGFVDPAATLDGTIRAEATVRGTAGAPEVPSFSVVVAGPTLDLDARGSVKESVLSAKATGGGDVARLADFARSFLPADTRIPPVRGRLGFAADLAGPLGAVAAPRFTLSLRGGAADLDVEGALTAAGDLTGTADVSAVLADAARWAKDAGYIDRPLAPAGRANLRADFAGTRTAIRVPKAVLAVTGPLEVTASGSWDGKDAVTGTARFRGEIQPVLDAAAQWTGGTARRVDGTIDGEATFDGTFSRIAAALPRLTVRAGGLEASAAGNRGADGALTASVTAKGPVPDLLNVLRAFGLAQDVNGTGVLDARANVAMGARAADGSQRATGAASATVTGLLLAQPAIGSGGPFREPRLSVEVPEFSYDAAAGRLAPARATVTMEGARLESVVAMEEGPPNADFTPSRIVRATDGRLVVEESFVRNHPEVFGDVAFRRAEGPFRFAGDVSNGRAGAAAWTGDATLAVTGLTAPHVVVETARAVARLDRGTIVVDPLEGAVNGGTVTAKARIGLVGERPEHAFDLTGRDVQLGADLAPLVARASPVFAVGEQGKTGGRANVDLHLTGRGFESEVLKRSLAGKGTLSLKDAYVESGEWIGTLLSLVGSSGRMDIAPVDVPFEVKDGKVRTGDVAMDGVGLLLRLGGEVALDGKLDYALRLKPKSGGGAFEKWASVLDPEGYLPLRLEGRLSKPKLKAPDVKDILTGKIGSLLDGLLGGKKEKEEPAPEPKDGPKKRRRDPQPGGQGTEAPGTDAPPPPPPPPARRDETPPPPPPPPPPRGEDVPPPPPPPPGR